MAKALALPSALLDPSRNKCYCSKCRPLADEKKQTKMTGPEGKQRISAIPFGWCVARSNLASSVAFYRRLCVLDRSRLGLRVHVKHSDAKLGVFTTWHSCYHGTGSDSVSGTAKTLKSILFGSLVAPGMLNRVSARSSCIAWFPVCRRHSHGRSEARDALCQGCVSVCCG